MTDNRPGSAGDPRDRSQRPRSSSDGYRGARPSNDSRGSRDQGRDPRDRDQRRSAGGRESYRGGPSRGGLGGRDDRRGPRSGRPAREDRSEGTYVPATSGRGSAHGPEVAPDAVIKELDFSVRKELSSLPGTLAEKVAGHLVMAGRLLDEDSDLAFAHARTAHDLAPRIVAVREALAAAAYGAGDYKTAMREARTVRRMAGDDSWLPMIADCERGLGRPERALDLLNEVDLTALPDPIQAECLMVLSGARRDLGQLPAAVAVLETDLLRSGTKSVWSARLRLAYSDVLAESGRTEEARKWLLLAAASDPEGTSGAGERLAEIDDIQVLDVMADGFSDGSPDASPTVADQSGPEDDRG